MARGMLRVGLLAISSLAVLVTPRAVLSLPPATCIPQPLPATPLQPTFTMNVLEGGSVPEASSLVLWRQPCQDGSGQTAVLVRISPVTTGPFVCSASVIIIQDAIQRAGRFKVVPTAEQAGFCGSLFVPSTFFLVEAAGTPALDTTGPFTLIYNGSPVTQLAIPAAGTVAPPPPSVLVVATGCTTCHSGQVVGYRMDFTNAGPPLVAEIKGGARLPDGSILAFVNHVVTLPTGASTLPLVPSQALPGGLPTIDLLVEAAILEPALGVTLSRHSVTLHLLP